MSIKLKYVALMSAVEELRALEATANAKKVEVDRLKAEFLALMKDTGTNTYSSDHGVVSIVEHVVPSVQSWPELYDNIAKTHSFDLLQRRVSTTAWRARLEAGETVPGVVPFTLQSLRIS